MNENIVCFIHSCNINIIGTEKLDMILNYLQQFDLYNKFKYIFINNVGNKIDEFKYSNDKIIATNYSQNTSFYENCTLKEMYFFSKFNPNYKILYLHTKGVGYNKNHPWYIPIDRWNRFMLYCLVDKYSECLEMLDYVDIVGCQYRCYPYDKDPSHFSGNFWWATSNYIKTNDIYHLKEKYDAEFWLFRKNPYFINIGRCEKATYYYCCDKNDYVSMVDNNVKIILYNLKNPDKVKILYGIENNYVDVTNICKEKLNINGIINIPPDDVLRANIFGDHIHGTLKHILIGNIKYPQNENIMIKL